MGGYLGLFIVVGLTGVAYVGVVFVVDLLMRKFRKPEPGWTPHVTSSRSRSTHDDGRPASLGDNPGGGSAGDGGSSGGGGASSSW